jgi:crossover junction endodeoxyribonuclease RuvC
MTTPGKKLTIVIGIDPGITGGIALYYDTYMDAIEMPVLRNPITKQYLGLDTDRIRGFLDCTILGRQIQYVCYIEQVHSMPGQGVASTFKFGQVYGEIIGMISTLGIQTHFVRPQAWKKTILGVDYPHDKAGAIQYLNDRGLSYKITPSGKRKPHDGMADAACIAIYGWNKEIGNAGV